jgi:hypothetical protein
MERPNGSRNVTRQPRHELSFSFGGRAAAEATPEHLIDSSALTAFWVLVYAVLCTEVVLVSSGLAYRYST